ncbi:MAG: choice-of-anchor L domain-containing protein [Tannerella sp.]|jgi:hypothetical protein|nr:choice-of-anchor L domain-containing protein [Tannerella sp.]
MRRRFLFITIISVLASAMFIHASVPVKKDTTSRKQGDKVETRMAYDDPVSGGPSAAYMAARPGAPLGNSIWVDRDAAIHSYTPTDLVRRILLNSHTPSDQLRIQNVEHSGWNWNPATGWLTVPRIPDDNVWGQAGHPGAPYNGVVTQYDANERSLAYFENGDNAGFEFDKGLLMGTGPILMAEGPNKTNHGLNDGMTNNKATHPTLAGVNTMHGVEEFGYGSFNPTGLPAGGAFYRKHQPNGPWNPDQSFDRDLDNLTQDNIMWTTVGSTLEFDFQPAISKATFDYVFASDEYPEGVYQANDIFGFFVTGPYDSPPGSDLENTTATFPLTDPTAQTEHTKANGVYYRYNIARLPDGKPVGIDYVNWGITNAMYTLTMTTNPYSVTTSADYDIAFADTMHLSHAALTYRFSTGYDATPGIATWLNANAPDAPGSFPTRYYFVPTNPQLFRYNHVGQDMMEYDGFTHKLQAVADSLMPGKWYHLKLAVAQTVQKNSTTNYVLDNNHGSAVFLTNLDLGEVEGDLNTPYMLTTFDNMGVDKDGNQFLYEGCDEYVMTMRFDTIAAQNQSCIHITYINIDGAAVQDLEGNRLFSPFTATEDSIMLTGYSDTIRHYRFKLSADYLGFENGQYVGIVISIPAGGSDTIFYSPLYKHATYDPVYDMGTDYYGATADLGVTNGSPMLHRSVNGQDYWRLNTLPFTQWELDEIGEEGFVLLREPNTCFPIDTVWLRDGIVIPPLIRTVTLPEIEGVVINPAPGVYRINSRDNFTFTITPLGRNADLQLVVATNRKLVSDTEGIKITAPNTRDGSYTITIYEIQEPVDVQITFTTADEAVENGKVWADGRRLYVGSATSGIATVYAETGLKVMTIPVLKGETVSTPLPAGFYIVKTGDGASYKIVIK